MLYGAIQGMLSSTGDPYTSFFDPSQTKEFSEDLSGSFEGIGAEMGIKQNVLTVIAPLSGSPSEKAGVRSGDKVLKIDGAETLNMTLEEAVSKIRGKKNTTVTLTIVRNGDEGMKDIQIVRDMIEVKSVKTDTFVSNIAYIQVSRFGEDTAIAFEKAVRSASAGSAKGIILDLRNNPGGYLDVAVQMAGRMLPKGETVLIEEDHNGKQKKDYASGIDLASHIPTVILINEGSASASEIVAGALRDNRDNVTLIGKKSFGKGSVQEFIPLPQKSAVKITVAKWLTPKGRQINNEGIIPDIDVDLSRDDYENDRDPQLDKAKEFLLKKFNN
jgi:carboxyl-terminal processing protease